MQLKTLVLFDFDGTITTRDTLFAIARFSNPGLFYWNIIRLMPVFVLALLKFMPKRKAKDVFLKRFFSPFTASEFKTLCEQFATQKLPTLIRPLAMEKIEAYQQMGAQTVIVSASPEDWIKPWADRFHIDVIATKLAFRNDHFIGIDGKNCNGNEKVKRITQKLDINVFDKVIAYGDSKGDLPMLALASESFFKPFR